MKIKQTNLGLIIEKSEAVQSVIDSYTKLEELKPEGISRRILDMQRHNINPITTFSVGLIRSLCDPFVNPVKKEIVSKTYFIGIGVDDFKQKIINNKKTK